MKKIALLVAVAILASTGCAATRGARGPVIQRTVDAPSQTDNTGSLDGRPELGQR